MKKLYTFLLGLAPLAVSAATLPYSSDFSNGLGALSDEWTLVDANKDGKTWDYLKNSGTRFSEIGYSGGLQYTYSNPNQADDWAISPALSVEAGKYYKISFWVESQTGSNERVSVYAAYSADPTNLSAGDMVLECNKDFSNIWAHKVCYWQAPEDGDAHIGLYAWSERNKYNIYLAGFEMAEYTPAPAAPANLVATIGEDKALKASLAWTLPTLTENGLELPSTITGIKIYRDGVLLTALPADATSFEDTTVPEPGFYSYEVSAMMGALEGAKAKVTTAWIGGKGVQNLPYSENFKNTDFFYNQWSVYDVNGDAANGSTYTVDKYNTWRQNWNTAKSAYWAALYLEANKAGDDWLISAPMKFPAAGKYKVSFRMSMYSGQSYGLDMKVCCGQGETPDDMTQLLGTVTSISSSTMNPAEAIATAFSFEFEVAQGGTYCIGFHETKKTSAMRRIHLGAFSTEVIELYEEAEAPVYDAPFNSADVEGWAPCATLCFNLYKGYYHTSKQGICLVADSNEYPVIIDCDFAEDYNVIVVPESATQATFKLDEGNFEEFTLASVDMRPATVEDLKYRLEDDGITFSWTNPTTSLGETPLYEILSIELLEGINSLYSSNDNHLSTGGSYEVFIPATDLPATTFAAEEPVYSLKLSNHSGDSYSTATNVTTGISNVTAVSDEALYFNLQGSRIDGKLQPGVYVCVKGGKATKVIVK